MKIRILFFLILFSNFVAAQQSINCQLAGKKSYPSRLSDIWGWQHSNGTEYALVGVYDGVSILNLADPTNPVEDAFIAGGSTIWRDLKTWGNYLYVSSEVVQEGILIADLSSLPNSVSSQYVYLTVGQDTIRNAHNLYVDENGFLYVAGADVANGAPLIFSLTNPLAPTYLGTCGTEYAHDMYVRGDTLWGSNVYLGEFSAFDISNKANPQLLAVQSTSSSFTHNAWISDDGNTLFTTDERANAYIDAYDVSDLSNIEFLDKWQPQNADIFGIIPHNVHVLNDFLVISHYTEGVIILDAKHPDNLVEVGRYDSYTGNGTGFRGCWGAYPFLPSGTLIISDIDSGFFALQPNYTRACRLEGNITDGNGLPIYDVLVEFDNTGIQDQSRLNGDYKTGYHQAGNYNVRFRKAGYLPQSINVELFNDSVVVRDIVMQSASAFNFSGDVYDNSSGAGIAAAKVKYIHSANFYEGDTTADASGNYVLNQIQEEEYKMVAGIWGHKTTMELHYLTATSNPVSLGLDSAYYDDFVLDYGWSVSGNVVDGAWERTMPNSVYQWAGLMPAYDLLNDIGNQCYITGVSQSNSDAGSTILESPLFDGTKISDPHLSFHYFFSSYDSTYAVTNDSLEIWLDNGQNAVMISSYKNGLYNWSPQQVYQLSNFLPITNTMKVRFIINNSNERNFMEAAIDKVQINSYITLTNVEEMEEHQPASLQLLASPVPFTDAVRIEFDFSDSKSEPNSHLAVYNLYGQLIETRVIRQPKGIIEMGQQWPKGHYFVQLQHKTIKIIKN